MTSFMLVVALEEKIMVKIVSWSNKTIMDSSNVAVHEIIKIKSIIKKISPI